MNHSRSILRTSPICFGATKNFTALLSSASGVRLTRSTKALEDFSYVAITSASVSGAFAIFPNSIPPSSACSLAFCSVTNIQARSFAALHLACGFRSDLAAGYALSTRIVVDSSFSSWVRNCCFSLMIRFSLSQWPWTRRASFSKHPVHPVSCFCFASSDVNNSCVSTSSVALPRSRNSTVTKVSGASGSLSQRQVYTSFLGGPLFHFLRRGPRLEDALRPRRERAPGPERDGGALLLSGGHADDSCALGWAR